MQVSKCEKCGKLEAKLKEAIKKRILAVQNT